MPVESKEAGGSGFYFSVTSPSLPEGVRVRGEHRTMSVRAGLGLAGAGRSGRPQVSATARHGAGIRQPTLSDVNLSVPDMGVKPLAAMMCTYQLGLVRHGEVLILYERPSGDADAPRDYALDIFDRMAIKVTSAMRAAIATSETSKPRGRKTFVGTARTPARLRAHYIRGFTAKAERGYKLHDRRVHVRAAPRPYLDPNKPSPYDKPDSAPDHRRT